MINPDLDMNLLRAFVTVAELGGFTAAAARLNRTQSAVSMQVRRLEESVGQKLLVRSSRRVRLTETGETLLHYARRILSLNDEALSEIGEPEVRGRVRLGIPDDYAAYFLPKVLVHFGSLYPRITMEVCCDLSVNLLPMVRQGEIDLALVTRQMGSSGGELVRREKLVWAEAQGCRVHLQDPLPLALFPGGVCRFREMALECLEEAGRRWRIACTSRGLAGIRSTVSAGLAVTVVTENTLSGDMRVIRPEEGLPELPSVELALHMSRVSSGEAVQVLAEHIRTTLKRQDGARPQESGTANKAGNRAEGIKAGGCL